MKKFLTISITCVLVVAVLLGGYIIYVSHNSLLFAYHISQSPLIGPQWNYNCQAKAGFDVMPNIPTQADFALQTQYDLKRKTNPRMQAHWSLTIPGMPNLPGWLSFAFDALYANKTLSLAFPQFILPQNHNGSISQNISQNSFQGKSLTFHNALVRTALGRKQSLSFFQNIYVAHTYLKNIQKNQNGYTFALAAPGKHKIAKKFGLAEDVSPAVIKRFAQKTVVKASFKRGDDNYIKAARLFVEIPTNADISLDLTVSCTQKPYQDPDYKAQSVLQGEVFPLSTFSPIIGNTPSIPEFLNTRIYN